MPSSHPVTARIEHLISEAPQIAAGSEDIHRQRAWLVAAQNAVQLVCPSKINRLRKNALFGEDPLEFSQTTLGIVAESSLQRGFCVDFADFNSVRAESGHGYATVPTSLGSRTRL
jgi:hypothetical protein